MLTFRNAEVVWYPGTFRNSFVFRNIQIMGTQILYWSPGSSGTCHVDIQERRSCLISRNIQEQFCIQEHSNYRDTEIVLKSGKFRNMSCWHARTQKLSDIQEHSGTVLYSGTFKLWGHRYCIEVWEVQEHVMLTFRNAEVVWYLGTFRNSFVFRNIQITGTQRLYWSPGSSGTCHVDMQERRSCLISRNIQEQFCIQEHSNYGDTDIVLKSGKFRNMSCWHSGTQKLSDIQEHSGTVLYSGTFKLRGHRYCIEVWEVQEHVMLTFRNAEVVWYPGTFRNSFVFGNIQITGTQKMYWSPGSSGTCNVDIQERRSCLISRNIQEQFCIQEHSNYRDTEIVLKSGKFRNMSCLHSGTQKLSDTHEHSGTVLYSGTFKLQGHRYSIEVREVQEHVMLTFRNAEVVWYPGTFRNSFVFRNIQITGTQKLYWSPGSSGTCHVDIQERRSCLISRNIQEQFCIQEHSNYGDTEIVLKSGKFRNMSCWHSGTQKLSDIQEHSGTVLYSGTFKLRGHRYCIEVWEVQEHVMLTFRN